MASHSVLDPYPPPPTGFATSVSAGIAESTPSVREKGFVIGDSGGTYLMNYIKRSTTNCAILVENAFTDAVITMSINPATDGRWLVLSGSIERDGLEATTFVPAAAPAQGVIGMSLSGIAAINRVKPPVLVPPMRQEKTTETAWNLTGLRLAYEFTAGALAVKVRQRPFGLGGPWISSTSFIFPGTPAGGAINSDAVNLPILPDNEYMLEIDMSTAAAATDVRIFGSELTFKRNDFT